jgi:hypothetical protein
MGKEDGTAVAEQEDPMTARTRNAIRHAVDEEWSWKDALVVASLVVILGAFVAQVASAPRRSAGSDPITAPAAAPVHVA